MVQSLLTAGGENAAQDPALCNAWVPYGQRTHSTAPVGDASAHIPHCVQCKDPSPPPQDPKYRKLEACLRALAPNTKQNKEAHTEHKAENNIPSKAISPVQAGGSFISW